MSQRKESDMKTKPFDEREAFARQAKGEKCVVWGVNGIVELIATHKQSAWIIWAGVNDVIPCEQLSLTIPTIKREWWLAIGKWNHSKMVTSNSGATQAEAESYWKHPSRTLIASHKFEWEEEA